jgi:hypothetical protein
MPTAHELSDRVSRRVGSYENAIDRLSWKERWDMADVLFDTQKMVKRLEDVGVAPAQARVHTAILSEVANALEATIMERCATKEDIARLEARIDKLAASVDVKMADLKSELIKWVVSVGILQMALIAGLVLKLAP